MNNVYEWQPFPDAMPPHNQWLFVTTVQEGADGSISRRVWWDVIAIIEDEELYFCGVYFYAIDQFGNETPVVGTVTAWMQYPEPYMPEEVNP